MLLRNIVGKSEQERSCISRRRRCKSGAAGFSFGGVAEYHGGTEKEDGTLNILLKENKGQPLTVTVEYPRYDGFVEHLVRGIRNLDGAVFGFEAESGARRKISIADILYIESVEKRTFIYTDGAVFGADCRLYEIETRLARRGIIRISKSCLMNIAVLESVRRIANSRLEAVLKNGMRLIVSRTYLKSIRDYLASEGL